MYLRRIDKMRLECSGCEGMSRDRGFEQSLLEKGLVAES